MRPAPDLRQRHHRRQAREVILFGTENQPHRALRLLAPTFRYQVEPTLRISQKGQIFRRITASYELLLTRRSIPQPRFGPSR